MLCLMLLLAVSVLLCQGKLSTDLCVCSSAIVHPFAQVTGPSAWYADQYRNSTEHVYTLTADDITELDVAVAAVLKSGKDIQVFNVASPPQSQKHHHPSIHVQSRYIHHTPTCCSFSQHCPAVFCRISQSMILLYPSLDRSLQPSGKKCELVVASSSSGMGFAVAETYFCSSTARCVMRLYIADDWFGHVQCL